MRIHTPRATPMVRAPAPSAPAPSEHPSGQPLLRPPVTLITPASDDLELHEGSLLVGRLPECDVGLRDGLVSRMHARISVRGDSVMVEDLHSTNGVYVNGLRIAHSALLCEGDRLLIGTTEISLFEARRGARVAPLRGRREPKQEHELEHAPRRSLSAVDGTTRRPAPTTLPAEPRGSFGKLDLHLDELAPEPPSETRLLAAPPTSAPVDLFSLRRRSPAVPSTARADALAVIGALAERLAERGNVDEARRVLSLHLKRILQGATAGLTVPEEVCAQAAHHSLSLARWTGQSVWIDFVVELHLAARRAMTPLTFTAFENVALSLGGFDRQLFSYYIDSLRDEGAQLNGEERQVIERLVRLRDA